MWSPVGKALEDRGEMGLGLKADAQRDIDQRQFGLAEQLLGALDSSLQDEVVWPHDVGQGDSTGQVGIDMVRDPLHSPFLKRCAAAARSGTLGSEVSVR